MCSLPRGVQPLSRRGGQRWRFHLHQSSYSRVVEDSPPVVEQHLCDFKQALARTVKRTAFNTTLPAATEKTRHITTTTSGEPLPLTLALAYHVSDAARLASGLEGYNSAAVPSLHTTNKAAILRELESRGGSSALQTMRLELVARRAQHSVPPLRETFSITCQKN